MVEHSSQDLAGKVALITGAGRGIGRAIARNLAIRGCGILGTCTTEHSRSHILSLSEEIKEYCAHTKDQCPLITSLVLSLENPEAATITADAVREHFGSYIDIFVSNAALVDRTPVGGLDPASVSRMLVGNIQTPAMIIDELVRRKYFRHGSRIIFISSAESSRCAPEA